MSQTWVIGPAVSRSKMAEIIAAAAPDDTIVVPAGPRLELAQRAAERLGKPQLRIITADESNTGTVDA